MFSIWYIVLLPLLASFLFTLIVYFRGPRPKRYCKILGAVPFVNLVVMYFIFGFVPFGASFINLGFLFLVFFILFIYFYVLKISYLDPMNRKSKKHGLVLIVLLIVILATTITFPKTKIVWDTNYRISILIENTTDAQENVVLYVPLPKDYPEEYRPFRSENHSVISTEHGKMLAISTNTSLDLTTTLTTFRKEYHPDDVPDITARSANMVYIYLQNTSRNVSVNLYFEIQYDDGPLTWEYSYMAAGSNPPSFKKSYFDSTSDELKKSRADFENQMLRLSPGWNEITLFEGTFRRST